MKCKDEKLDLLSFTKFFVDHFPYFQFNKNLTAESYFHATWLDPLIAMLHTRFISL
jgi:hypothetical protein